MIRPSTPRVFSALALVLSLAALVLVSSGCAPRALRGGEGTANPDLDRPAMSVLLDRDDITYLVDGYLGRLESSAFWQQRVKGSAKQPILAIWPIRNATSQHLDDQMLWLLSSIETSLINSGAVAVVDRSRQEELAREIGIQQGSIYDPASAQRLGRQLGAQYFVTGKITSVDERLNKKHRVQYSLFLQIIEIETGVIRFQDQIDRSKQIER
ncbi:MAG: CsgG/HfaB family protein [Myxococcota bacterium]